MTARRASFVALIVIACNACGRVANEVEDTPAPPPPASDGGRGSGVLDGGDDSGAIDANADVSMGSCIGPCVTGQSTCLDGRLATCAKDEHGCNVWGAPTACATNEICEQTLIRAACVCRPGTVTSPSGCVPVVAAPRPIAPLSTAKATSQKPTFRWQLAPGTDGAQVDICRDRACTVVETTFAATGSSGVPSAALTPGVHFWRVRGRAGATLGSDTSPVWQVRIGARSAGDTSWGAVPDLDGDGFADVVIGAVNTNGFADYSIYRGGAGGLATAPDVVHGPITGYGSFDLREVTVAAAGDVNGDGYADLVSTTLGDNANGANVCIVHVFLGGPTGMSATSIAIETQGTNWYDFRAPLRAEGVGDVNGDGYADIIATTSYVAPIAYVFLGGPSGPSATPLVLTQPLDATYRAAGAGDVNGDGYADVLVATLSYTGHGSNAFLYLGGPSGPTTPPISLPGEGVGAGDVNGDGLADIAIGNQLYFGSATPLSAGWWPIPQNGFPTRAAGDVNGDGYGDLVVSSSSSTAGQSHLYVTLGGPFGPSKTTIDIPGSEPFFATDVCGAGDVDGDGYDDVLAASPNAPSLSVGVFLGGAKGTVPTAARVFSGFYSFGVTGTRP